jgi:hypothetical protein
MFVGTETAARRILRLQAEAFLGRKSPRALVCLEDELVRQPEDLEFVGISAHQLRPIARSLKPEAYTKKCET